MKKTVVYLHGLQKSNSGKKVSLISETCMVYAPSLDYTKPNVYDDLLEEVKLMKPDLIIGSSMGGYFAYLLSSELGIPVLMFNPALHSRSIWFPNKIGNLNVKGDCFLGENDVVIEPQKTIEILKNESEDIKIKIIKNGTHRTPFETFKEIWENIND